MSGWQPIETAPRDELVSILVWGPGYEISVCSWWERKRTWVCMADGSMAVEYMSDFGTDYQTIDAATHWMPLPEPPTT